MRGRVAALVTVAALSAACDRQPERAASPSPSSPPPTVAPFCDGSDATTVRVRFPGAELVTAVAADPTAGNAVVATSDGSRAALSVVDARTCAVEATVELRGLVAHGVAVEPGARAYVTDGDDGLTVVDLAGRRIVRTLATGHEPGAVAVSPARHLVLVVNTFDEIESDRSSVSIVDTLTGASTKIEGLPLPADVAVDESGNRLLATVRGGLLVAALPTGKPRRTVAFGTLPRQVAVDAARGRALVADADEKALYVVRLSDLTRSGRIGLPGAPSGLAVDPVTGSAYVTVGEPGVVVRVDVDGAGVPSVGARVDLGGDPDAAAVDGVRKQVYVVDRQANVLDVLSFAAFG